MKNKISLVIVLFVLIASTMACRLGSATDGDESAPAREPTATTAPGGPCYNILYPFDEGRQWVYQKVGVEQDATPDPLTSRFGISVVDVTESGATLNMVDLGTGTTTQTSVECQDGAITNFPSMTVGSLFGNYLAGDIQAVYISGVFAPRAEDMEASDWTLGWEGEYQASGTVTYTGEGESTSITLEDSPIHLTWQIAGQESVTVPAGTFAQAYKVTRTAQVQASITFEGMTGAGTITVESVHWYEPYTGLLKTEIRSAMLTVFGISFPIEASGAVELVEVH